MTARPYAEQARALCTEDHDSVWFCSTCRLLEMRLTPIHQIPGFAELLADANCTITIRSPFAVDNLPAARKWLVRSERLPFNSGWAWTVTAPSGARRWFASWSMMQTLAPFFVMGEQCPPLRDEMPEIYDAGVPV